MLNKGFFRIEKFQDSKIIIKHLDNILTEGVSLFCILAAEISSHFVILTE